MHRQHDLADNDEEREWSYNRDLRPLLTPWRDLRKTLRLAGCFTTRALPRLTTEPSGEAGEDDTHIVNRTDTSATPLTLPAVCRKPIVLLSGRTRDCASCNRFAAGVLGDYAAEWSLVRAHITLVDAGDPMTEQLVRYPYPLWYDAEALEERMVLTPLTDMPGFSSFSEGGDEASAGGTMATDAAADYALFSASLRQKAALLVQAPEAQAGHWWSHLVRHTFAYPNEYVLRIVFMYPHNGSVMRDVVNEGVLEGSSPDYPHFFTNVKHFFRAVKKAVRVMDWLERFGDY